MARLLLTLVFVLVPYFGLTGVAIHWWSGEDGEGETLRFVGFIATIVIATLLWQWSWWEAGRMLT